MYLILIIVLLSFNTTFTADQNPQDIVNELVNYGDIYFERILPVESQTETFKNNIKQINPHCEKVLGFIDETISKNLISSSGDRNKPWKKDLLKIGYFQLMAQDAAKSLNKYLNQITVTH